jgi:pimeloyl-ACP methyl ester carboxylesterase
MAPYDYTAIAEDLASHGWVTVGVASPRLSRFIRDDGSPIAPMPATPVRFLQHFDSADVFLEPMAHAVAADIRFVVRKLELVDRTDTTLRGHLDLGRLAMMGHSNGALAASRACAEEGRCRAFLGIEGTQTREIRKQGASKPYALLISDQSLGYDAENVYRELGTRRGSAYTVVIVKGAGHNSATDLLLIRPSMLHYPIAPARGVEIARVAIRAFLDRNLPPRNGVDLRSALGTFPEVEVQTSFH